MKEDKTIKLGDIDIAVRICSRAKRIKLRAASQIELILPKYANFDTAYKFLLSKELWVKNQVRKLKAIKQESAKTISILGEEYQIILNDPHIKEPIRIVDKQLVISSVIAHDKVKPLLATFLKKIFKKEVERYTVLKANELQVKYSKITVRDTVSRWGSCSSSGNLSFSWRLILAPKNVMEYVIVHELCHLKEMNHSIRFWKLVESVCPEYKAARAWLENNGKYLHHI